MKNAIRNHWLISLSLLLAVLPVIFYLNDKRHQATSGTLVGTGDANRRSVLIGGARFFPESVDGIFLRDGNDPLLEIHIEGGKLFVSTRIRNERGELLAELRDNQWSHQPRPAIFDRNYTDHVLEIKDSNGEVALQVVDFGQTVYVAGLFRCKDGRSWAIGPFHGGAVMELRLPGKSHDYHVTPICGYPSDSNLGVCPGIASIQLPPPDDQSGYLIRGSLDLCPKVRDSNPIPRP